MAKEARDPGRRRFRELVEARGRERAEEAARQAREGTWVAQFEAIWTEELPRSTHINEGDKLVVEGVEMTVTWIRRHKDGATWRIKMNDGHSHLPGRGEARGWERAEEAARHAREGTWVAQFEAIWTEELPRSTHINEGDKLVVEGVEMTVTWIRRHKDGATWRIKMNDGHSHLPGQW